MNMDDNNDEDKENIDDDQSEVEESALSTQAKHQRYKQLCEQNRRESEQFFKQLNLPVLVFDILAINKQQTFCTEGFICDTEGACQDSNDPRRAFGSGGDVRTAYIGPSRRQSQSCRLCIVGR
jgi:hypothetical protein